MMTMKSYIRIYISLLLFTNIFNRHEADDTITTTKWITGDETIVSSNGVYELGFFSRTGNPYNYYIGMWFRQVSVRTIIWVANRDSPVDKLTNQLKILDGNLVLGGSRTRIWSTDIVSSSSSNSIVAVLRNDGNLVLINGSDQETLWESFNHPTNTFLPGAKLGYNKLTQSNQMLRSWKNSEDPGVGFYSFEMNHTNKQFTIQFNRSGQYWTPGNWDGSFFSLVPEMRLNYIYNYSYINNENETYFTYSLYDTSILSMLVLDVTGQIKMFTWGMQEWNLFWSQPRRGCDSYAYCGAFSVCETVDSGFGSTCTCLSGYIRTLGFTNDSTSGCVRKTNLECAKDRFLHRTHLVFPESSELVASRSRKECETFCLNICSCTAYAYNDDTCLIWNGVLMNLKRREMDDVNRQIIYFRVSSSEFPRSKNRVVMIGIVVGCILGVLALLGFVWIVIFRRRVKNGEFELQLHEVDGSLVVFKYNDLRIATKNFSEKLGGGSFGSVFKGTINRDSGTFIAVKRLEGISQGEKQFRAEVSTIGTIHHVNLVRLLGFCSEPNKKLLVYEYMPSGSLNSHLFNAKDSNVLNWKKRYGIAIGIARGLNYLHEKCRDCIIHCDIKPENILLDSDFLPKVADFGLAKFFRHDFSRVLTTIRGTRGYLAPEWISGVAITTKADVYSYGMMLFELVSGRRNAELSSDSEVRFFPIEAATVTIREDDLRSLVDQKLENEVDMEEVKLVCRVACWCIQDEENLRPSMGQVIQILERVSEVKLPPMPLSLKLLSSHQDEDVRFFSDRLLSGPNSDAEDLPLNTSW